MKNEEKSTKEIQLSKIMIKIDLHFNKYFILKKSDFMEIVLEELTE